MQSHATVLEEQGKILAEDLNSTGESPHLH